MPQFLIGPRNFQKACIWKVLNALQLHQSLGRVENGRIMANNEDTFEIGIQTSDKGKVIIEGQNVENVLKGDGYVGGPSMFDQFECIRGPYGR